jgi:hypothetical protein
MRENCMSGSMRGHRKRATSQRACVLLYERPSNFFFHKTEGRKRAGGTARLVNAAGWAG